MGDFNIWCCRLDACKGQNLRSDQSREALAQIMNTEDLVDVWREENPEVRDFSRRQIVLVTLKQSRIDLCLIKRNLKENIRNCKYNFCYLSDRAALSFDFVCYERSKEGGMWCFNASLLSEKQYKELTERFLKSEYVGDLIEKDPIEGW